MFRCFASSNLYFDGAKVITRCVHKGRCEWLETLTCNWKFSHELSFHFCFDLPAERTLALDNFGNFVPFDYPILSSVFGSSCCDSWVACLMYIAGEEHRYPMIRWQKSGMLSYDMTAGLTRPPTRTIPLCFTNGLNDL